jgi:phosphoribosylformylglycinamidine synthase
VTAAEKGLMESAHDVSEGGFAVALAESCINGDIGADVTIPKGRRADEAMFGEGGGRVIISCHPDNVAAIQGLATGGITATVIGEVGGDDVLVTIGGSTTQVPRSQLREVWEGAIPQALEA